jgi:hypothetical protein
VAYSPELTTVSAVQIDLGIATDTAILTAKLAAAENLIRSMCNRRQGWTSATVTEVFNGEDASKLVLTCTPVQSITSIVVANAAGATSTTVSSDLYTYASDTGIVGFTYTGSGLWQAGYWPVSDRGARFQQVPAFDAGFQNVTVIYVGGYSAATIPPELTEAAKQLTTFMYESRTIHGGFRSEDLGNYSYEANDVGLKGFCEELRAGLLADYIRHGAFS